MFVGTPLTFTIRLPFTRPFRNGAAGLSKICCWVAVDCLAVCAQLVVCMAMTKTVLTCWAKAAEAEQPKASASTHTFLVERACMKPPGEKDAEVESTRLVQRTCHVAATAVKNRVVCLWDDYRSSSAALVNFGSMSTGIDIILSSARCTAGRTTPRRSRSAIAFA